MDALLVFDVAECFIDGFEEDLAAIKETQFPGGAGTHQFLIASGGA